MATSNTLPSPVLSLPDELLLAIFEELQPSSLECCSAVCHRFYRLAVPIIYKDIRLYVHPINHMFQRLTRNGSQLPRWIESAQFDETLPSNEAAVALVALVEAAKRLTRIKYTGEFHMLPSLLDTISRRPEVVLEVQVQLRPHRDDDELEWMDLDDMQGFSSPALQKLDLFVATWDLAPHETIVRCLSRTVKTCPNLRSLSFAPYIWPRSRRMGGNDSLLDLDIASSDVLPQIEEYSYMPLSLETISTWASGAGWRSLAILKLDNPAHLDAFSGRVPSLNMLVISGRDFGYHYLENIAQFTAPIRRLHIQEPERFDLPVHFLSQFSTTLEELVVQPPSCLFTPTMSSRASHGIDQLPRACPKLRKLYVYLRADIVWEHACLNAISKLQQLEQVIFLVNTKLAADREPGEEVSLRALRVQALHWLYVFKLFNPSSPLSLLGLHDKDGSPTLQQSRESFMDIATVTVEVQDLLENSKVIPKAADSLASLDDYTFRSQLRKLTMAECRPFFVEFPFYTRPELILFARKLGEDWVHEELVLEGLISRNELTRSEPRPLEHPIRNNDSRTNAEWRTTVKTELQYLKRINAYEEKHGKYTTLFDVLYPFEEIA
ncbi:hypothetical protein BT63DRAFT_456376 [Microthyrium microscopicum]|uniref:F-box domain-containing protein n=1 Tax=Microthyrium microscopicum TaxID=703497 RepID=A0A6A6U8Y6_9PEZI|nr:hypothetical protein BT63DRAFT_456376 [Microthyrium microscopicum]